MMMFIPPSIEVSLTKLWNTFSLDGLTSTRAIEHISYLLTLKLCSESDMLHASLPDHLCWKQLLAVNDEHLIPVTNEALNWLQQNDPSGSGLFHAASHAISKVSVLREVMRLMDVLFSTAWPAEMQAHFYEALLKLSEEENTAWAGRAGRFYTAPHLASLLTSLLHPKPGETICDYACGNGRLLSAAYAQLSRFWCDLDLLRYAADGQPLPLNFSFTLDQRLLLDATPIVGIDLDSGAALQAWVLLRLQGMKSPQIYAMDTLAASGMDRLLCGTKEGQGYDILLANPPYSSKTDLAGLDERLRGVKTTKAELLFLERAFHLLRPGGRAAIIVPDSVLFNTDQASVSIRQRLVSEHCLHAVISLPQHAFSPFTGVKTSILIFTHSGETRETIWSYTVSQDGYSLDKRRRPQFEQSDLPDLAVHYHLRFADSLGSCQPAAFIDGDAELCWDNNIEPSTRNHHYVRPIVADECYGSENAEATMIPRFKYGLPIPVNEPKCWDIRLDELHEPLILTPGRYQEFSLLPGGSHPDTYSSQPASRKEALGSQRNPESLFYLPGVKDEASLANWYHACLEKLWSLQVQRELSAAKHIELLQLVRAIRSGQEKAYQRWPFEPGETPLTPVDVEDAAGVLPWFRGAIKTLQRKRQQGKLSEKEFVSWLALLTAVKQDLERRVGRIESSPLFSQSTAYAAK